MICTKLEIRESEGGLKPEFYTGILGLTSSQVNPPPKKKDHQLAFNELDSQDVL